MCAGPNHEFFSLMLYNDYKLGETASWSRKSYIFVQNHKAWQDFIIHKNQNKTKCWSDLWIHTDFQSMKNKRKCDKVKVAPPPGIRLNLVYAFTHSFEMKRWNFRKWLKSIQMIQRWCPWENILLSHWVFFFQTKTVELKCVTFYV